MFRFNEIFSCLQITSPEEMESKYERTLCMSLTAYIKLLESVKNLNEEKQNKLLDTPKFWKYAKHKENTI